MQELVSQLAEIVNTPKTGMNAPRFAWWGLVLFLFFRLFVSMHLRRTEYRGWGLSGRVHPQANPGTMAAAC